jgi:hypothetical protein
MRSSSPTAPRLSHALLNGLHDIHQVFMLQGYLPCPLARAVVFPIPHDITSNTSLLINPLSSFANLKSQIPSQQLTFLFLVSMRWLFLCFQSSISAPLFHVQHVLLIYSQCVEFHFH